MDNCRKLNGPSTTGRVRPSSAASAATARACPTGAAIRVAPDEFLTVARLESEVG